MSCYKLNKMIVFKRRFLQLILLSILGSSLADDNFSRNLTTQTLCATADVECKSVEDCPCVIHVTASGATDVLHYVLVTRSTPTLLMAHTKKQSKLNIDWPSFLAGNSSSGSLQFNPKPDSVVAVMLTKLIEFDDVNDTANLDRYASSNVSWIKSYSMANVTWSNATIDDHLTVHLNIINFEPVLPAGSNGSLSLKFNMFTSNGFSSELPHLPHNANLSLVEVELRNLIVERQKSRFAVEVVVATSEEVGKDMKIDIEKSFDDSLTPGSFTFVDWLTDEKSQEVGAFLQWKPVCYTSSSRSMQSSTRASYYSLKKVNVTDYHAYERGLLFAYFGSRVISDVNVRASNVSFGGDQDGLYYNGTRYTIWSFSTGFGVPPHQRVSLIIILVVSIGLGIPFLLIIAGVVYVVVKRCLGAYSSYSLIANSYAEIN